MIVYENIKGGFIGDVRNGILAKNIERQYKEKIGGVSEGVKRSWENSLTRIATILNDSDLIEESLVIGAKDGKDDVEVKAKIFPNIEAIKEFLGNKIPTKEDVRKVISDIVKKVNAKLPNFKHIKSFKILDEDFERTTTNKVKRFGKNMEDEK